MPSAEVALPIVNEPAGKRVFLAEPHVEHIARVLLRRYGVVFRKLLEREDGLPPWRELFYVYRRLEARGEIRGGRFVSGFSGEQFALNDAAALLRKVADTRGDGGSTSPSPPPTRSIWSASSPLARKCRACPATACCFENGRAGGGAGRR